MTERHRMGKRGTPKRGQSLVIVAFGIITLVAFVGLAVDLGLVYVERIRVRRAADAAALAAAADLPLEAAAHLRALAYLEENNYPCGLTSDFSGGSFSYACSNPEARVEVNPGYAQHYTTGPSAGEAARIIHIDTISYRDDVNQSDSANLIEVEVTSRVPLYFMRLIGFDSVPVIGRAVGENINNLDVVLVFDKSGSMEFDTLCYGCWTEETGMTYPEGDRWPLPWSDSDSDGNPDHCEGGGGDTWTYSSREYIVIEAEEYSYNSVPYNRDLYNYGMSYWVLQRNGGSNRSQLSGENAYLVNSSGAGAYGRDYNGAYMSHHPYRSRNVNSSYPGTDCRLSDVANGEMCNRSTALLSLGGPFRAPRLDYVFTVPESRTWYFYARGIGGGWGQNIMWSVDGGSISDVGGFTAGSTGEYNGADPGRWDWDRLGSQLLNAGEHTLHIWAGGAGFDLDRIIISTNNQSSGENLPSAVRNTWTHQDNNRTGTACDPCDPRFGGSPATNGQGGQPPFCQVTGNPTDPVNRRFLDDIYDDEQPIRGSVEAAKNFIGKLDPAYDQIGFVPYSGRANDSDRVELQCVRRLGSENCTSQVITNTVISALDNTHADGNTNIGEGIKDGIEVLSNLPGHYGRPSAAHIMVLMTDGEANQTAGLDTSQCTANLWPGDSSQAKDCVVYYAMVARNNGIVVYTITLGESADIELMQYVAELTGGVHRHAPRVEQLGPIFDELYQRIFLRLVE
ncbi:MAG: VWA domain-containing protein [Anaerolineae bacterium]|nr:VWA domain-containing protein [Anaerolineae bacterium]